MKTSTNTETMTFDDKRRAAWDAYITESGRSRSYSNLASEAFTSYRDATLAGDLRAANVAWSEYLKANATSKRFATKSQKRFEEYQRLSKINQETWELVLGMKNRTAA